LKKEPTGFWAEVAELRQLIKLKLQAGYGRAALREAVKEQIRGTALSSTDTQLTKTLKKQGLSGLETALKDVPPGQQLRMSAKEYRKLTGR
jgi:hypothetical protein